MQVDGLELKHRPIGLNNGLFYDEDTSSVHFVVKDALNPHLNFSENYYGKLLEVSHPVVFG